jgi:hypothetical protein
VNEVADGLAAPLDLRTLARSVFDLILAGNRRAHAVAHPLDFICLPLVRTPVFGVCAHMWRDRQAASIIHSHSWHLHSEVVLGAIANEVFAVTEFPGSDYELVRIESSGSLDSMVPTARAVLVEGTERTIHRPGNSYGLAAGVFHRSLPMSNGPTLTLLAATTVAGAHDHIIVSRSEGHKPAIRRETLSTKAALSLVTLFRDVVSGSRPHGAEETLPRRSPVLIL